MPAAAENAKFFRVAEVDGAWWFVTPDGKPFFSSGVNVIDVGATRDRYNPRATGVRRVSPLLRHRRLGGCRRTTACRDWGFNTVGGWSAREMTAGPMPYTFVLHLGKELGVPWNDVFAADFADDISRAAEAQVVSRANDARLIGWYTDNELAWFADTLFAFHIAQSAKSATRQAAGRSCCAANTTATSSELEAGFRRGRRERVSTNLPRAESCCFAQGGAA